MSQKFYFLKVWIFLQLNLVSQIFQILCRWSSHKRGDSQRGDGWRLPIKANGIIRDHMGCLQLGHFRWQIQSGLQLRALRLWILRFRARWLPCWSTSASIRRRLLRQGRWAREQWLFRHHPTSSHLHAQVPPKVHVLFLLLRHPALRYSPTGVCHHPFRETSVQGHWALEVWRQPQEELQAEVPGAGCHHLRPPGCCINTSHSICHQNSDAMVVLVSYFYFYFSFFMFVYIKKEYMN